MSPVQPAKGAIELEQITKRYGRERVVDSIDASIAPGEFFSLLGPSGSGKTTTLMMVAGFASVDEGRIVVDGVDVAGLPAQRRGFGMVFQNYAIFPHLNVFENVAFPLRARSIAKDEISKRVVQALELVRLERFTDRFSRQLSGGQQQRVAIARAIVYQPPVVLMDEPLGALDKNLRYQMQVEIKEIQRRLGMTVVYVTHDQEEAMNMSDRIAIMNAGRIEQIASPTEIYENPASVFVAKFLGEANLLEGVVEGVDKGIATLRLDSGPILRARASDATRPGVRASLFVRPERITIHSARLRSASTTRADPNAPMNRVAGRLDHSAFLGNIHRYSFSIGAESKVSVDLQNRDGGISGSTDPVELSWRVADSVVLASPSDAQP